VKNVIIFAPTERETEHFAAHGLHAHVCGVGMAECAAAAARAASELSSDAAQSTLFVLAGIAGVYGDRLAVGDTVVVATETVADLGRREADGGFTPMFQKTYHATFTPRTLPAGIAAARGVTVNMAGGMGATLSVEGVPEGIAVENMEGAAFFAVCARFGVPAMEVRTVSNRVGEAVTAPNLDTAARRLAADLKKIVSHL